MRNKRIHHNSNIMSKRRGIFTENVIIFSSAGRTRNMPGLEFDIL